MNRHILYIIRQCNDLANTEEILFQQTKTPTTQVTLLLIQEAARVSSSTINRLKGQGLTVFILKEDRGIGEDIEGLIGYPKMLDAIRMADTVVIW